jgi:hypothetical protein
MVTIFLDLRDPPPSTNFFPRLVLFIRAQLYGYSHHNQKHVTEPSAFIKALLHHAPYNQEIILVATELKDYVGYSQFPFLK